MEVTQLTGKGNREINQDYICIDQLESGATLFLIADGMGGYDKGDEAARIVCTNILTFLNHVEGISEQIIQQAIQKSNLAIKQFNAKNNIRSGATIGGTIVEKDGTTHAFWVGDVMIYLINRGKVLFQSKGHTLINRLIESDSMSNMNLLRKYKHIVTRSISGKPADSTIGYYVTNISNYNLLVICSDGISNSVSIEQLLILINMRNDLKELEKYVKECEDNYSIITLTLE